MHSQRRRFKKKKNLKIKKNAENVLKHKNTQKYFVKFLQGYTLKISQYFLKILKLFLCIKSLCPLTARKGGGAFPRPLRMQFFFTCSLILPCITQRRIVVKSFRCSQFRSFVSSPKTSSSPKRRLSQNIRDTMINIPITLVPPQQKITYHTTPIHIIKINVRALNYSFLSQCKDKRPFRSPSRFCKP